MASRKTRRRFLTVLGSGSLLTMAGSASASDGEFCPIEDGGDTGGEDDAGTASEDQQTAETQASSQADDSLLPSNPSAHTYATLSANDQAPTATLIGNFKCPYTNEFVESSLDGIVASFVETGQLQLEFRQLAHDPNNRSQPYISENGQLLSEVARGVWVEEPENYLDFFDSTWERMPTYVSPSDLVGFVEAGGVENAAAIVEGAQQGRYAGPLTDTADLAAAHDLSAIPRVVFAGDMVHARTSDLEGWIEARL